jgi:hypothetical protein
VLCLPRGSVERAGQKADVKWMMGWVQGGWRRGCVSVSRRGEDDGRFPSPGETRYVTYVVVLRRKARIRMPKYAHDPTDRRATSTGRLQTVARFS